jgi:hypothetical protein
MTSTYFYKKIELHKYDENKNYSQKRKSSS